MVPKNTIPRLIPAPASKPAPTSDATIAEIIAHAKRGKVSVVALFNVERLYVPVERTPDGLWLFDIQDNPPTSPVLTVEVIVPLASIIFVLCFAEQLDRKEYTQATHSFIGGPIQDMRDLLERRAAEGEDAE